MLSNYTFPKILSSQATRQDPAAGEICGRFDKGKVRAYSLIMTMTRKYESKPGRRRHHLSGGAHVMPAFATPGVLMLTVVICCLAACQAKKAERRPDIIWVVWDTVRADHLSLYGYNKKTTPFLETWSEKARVYTDCLSAETTTLPSHLSMFTGYFPGEHRVPNSGRSHIDDRFETFAEIVQREGYATYLYSANPLVSQETNISQGFETIEHPWLPEYKDTARNIIQARREANNQGPGLSDQPPLTNTEGLILKDSGILAQRGVENFLKSLPASKPYFIFLNYMEAHQPLVPSSPFRDRCMSSEQKNIFYTTDFSFDTLWLYVFGLIDYTAEELDAFAAAYDSCLAELDDLFRKLIEYLEHTGRLDNTIVILTSDHGEHLGEHHLLEHQFSLYDPLLRVPLVIYDPRHFPAGRDQSPVMNCDLFCSLLNVLELKPTLIPRHSQDIRSVSPDRTRFAEYLISQFKARKKIAKKYPEWDFRPFQRTYRGIFDKHHKLILASDGHIELYDRASDPGELHNLAHLNKDMTRTLLNKLISFSDSLQVLPFAVLQQTRMSEETKTMLEMLGYLAPDDDHQ